MSDQSNAYQASAPNPDLQTLNPLVGTWKVGGELEGTTTYEWLEGGYFLVQRYNFVHDGRPVVGVEYIGHEQPFGAEPSADLKSRIYDNEGNTFEYVYELQDGVLTIWAGGRGSPAYYQGTFSADFNSVMGAWVYPDGGGYTSNMTRVK